MFQAPEYPSKSKIVFRLNAPESGKFGAPMKSFIKVEAPVQEEQEEAIKQVPTEEQEEAVEEEEEQIPYVEEEENVEVDFPFTHQLNCLTSMGFSKEQAEAVLVAT